MCPQPGSSLGGRRYLIAGRGVCVCVNIGIMSWVLLDDGVIRKWIGKCCLKITWETVHSCRERPDGAGFIFGLAWLMFQPLFWSTVMPVSLWLLKAKGWWIWGCSMRGIIEASVPSKCTICLAARAALRQETSHIQGWTLIFGPSYKQRETWQMWHVFI